jgi:hypothetical protein
MLVVTDFGVDGTTSSIFSGRWLNGRRGSSPVIPDRFTEATSFPVIVERCRRRLWNHG